MEIGKPFLEEGFSKARKRRLFAFFMPKDGLPRIPRPAPSTDDTGFKRNRFRPPLTPVTAEHLSRIPKRLFLVSLSLAYSAAAGPSNAVQE